MIASLIKESNKSSLRLLSINSTSFKSSNLIELSLALNSASIRASNSKSLSSLESISLNISSSSSSSSSIRGNGAST